MSSDSQAIHAECFYASANDREISDGCARAIAAGYMSGIAGASFATTGAISDPTDVWRDLFYVNGRSMYPGMSAAEKLAADMLGTYLGGAGKRGPVDGWSSLWIR
jgi:hypothetical protein